MDNELETPSVVEYIKMFNKTFGYQEIEDVKYEEISSELNEST
jgi:hypothetical protein